MKKIYKIVFLILYGFNNLQHHYFFDLCWWWIGSNVLYTFFIFGAICYKQVIGFCLCRVIHIGIVQQILNTQQDLQCYQILHKQTCFIVILGFQSASSFKILRHTVPLGYTLGWNKTGTNRPIRLSKKKYLTFGWFYGVLWWEFQN